MLTSICALLLVASPLQDSAPLPSESLGKLEQPLEELVLDSTGKFLYSLDTTKLLVAWDLRKREKLWESQLREKFTFGLDVGRDLLVTTSGFPATNLYRRSDGSSAPGDVGGPLSKGGISRCECVGFTAKDRWVWFGDESGKLIRVEPGNVNGWSKRTLENGGITCFAKDKSFKKWAVGGKDGTIRFFNPTSASVDKKKVLEGHTGEITALTWDARFSGLASASSTGELWIWGSKSVKTKLPKSDSPVHSLAFGPKSKWLAVGNAVGVIQIYSTKQGELLQTLKGEGTSPICDLILADKGKTLVAGGSAITLWDVSDL